MRILLVAPKNNYYEPSPRINIFGQGLPYVAASLKQQGHEVHGINFSYQWCGLSAKSKLEELLKKEIYDFQPDWIGTGGLSAEYACIRDIINLSRKYAPHTPVVLGGNILTYDREWIFENLRPDVGIVGEAEIGFLKYSDNNLSYWRGGTAIYNPVVHPNLPLDGLPFPDYDIFNYKTQMEQFTQTDIFYGYVKQKPRIVPISLARSCPYHCTFCVHRSGAKYRQRSIPSAIAEIRHLYNKYEFNVLFVYDELFSRNQGRILDFCEAVTKLHDEGMDFVWTCDLRVDHMDKIPLKEMKESGCAFIGYGIESGSQRILDSMKKKITVSQLKEAIKLTNEAEIGIQGNIILGDPLETLDTIQESIDFYNENCTDLMINMGHIVPYPGSELFDYCLQSGVIKNKQKYYEKGAQYPVVAQFNMTHIPNRTWFKVVHNIEQWLDDRVTKSKEAPILNIIETDQKADQTYPEELRRTLYWITIGCPHCKWEVDYLVPLGTVRVPIRTACSRCNKAFIFNPPGIPQSWRYKVEAKAWGYLPPPIRLFIFNLIWRAIQIKAFIRSRGKA